MATHQSDETFLMLQLTNPPLNTYEQPLNNNNNNNNNTDIEAEAVVILPKSRAANVENFGLLVGTCVMQQTCKPRGLVPNDVTETASYRDLGKLWNARFFFTSCAMLMVVVVLTGLFLYLLCMNLEKSSN